MAPRRIAAVLLLLLALAPSTLGCEDGHAEQGPGASIDGAPIPGLRSPASAAQPSTPAAPLPTAPSSPEVVIPLDDRAVVSSGRVATAIRGGTLLLTPRGELAIAADPERDLVSVVDVFLERLEHTLKLEQGDEPSRLVMDGAGLVHVVLAGRDQIAAIDPETGTLLARRDVCRAPRGLGYDPARDVLHVACATGELWTFPAAPADHAGPVRMLSLPTGLRDVLVDGDRLWVSRFKSAELLELDATGRVLATRRPNPTRSSRGLRATEVTTPRFAPNGAYRIALAPDGGVAMLHQRALVDAIKLDPNMPASANGYYGGNCGGIVESAITVFRPDGTSVVSGALTGTLAVDLAISSAGAAVAFAGGPDDSGPRPDFSPVTKADGALVIALQHEPVELTAELILGCDSGELQATAGQIVSIAQRADGAVLVAQSREPAQLEILRKPGGSTAPVVALAPDSVLDTGHELFHRSPDGGVTCASCHLEGGEDGHVWSFDPLGPRRTQAVDVGLGGTEPFHWDGDMPDLNALVEEVMVVRMGGVHQSSARVQALADFMFALQPLPPSLAADDPAALRGKALFESSETGCTECHAGDALTGPDNHDVGTGEALQVPSLRGIEYRAPFMHDGCAPTLRARFDEPCAGGDQHGHTSQLASEQVDDLVAFLRSL